MKLSDSIDPMNGWMFQFAPTASCRKLFEAESSRGHWKKSERRGMHQMINILKINTKLPDCCINFKTKTPNNVD